MLLWADRCLRLSCRLLTHLTYWEIEPKVRSNPKLRSFANSRQTTVQQSIAAGRTAIIFSSSGRVHRVLTSILINDHIRSRRGPSNSKRLTAGRRPAPRPVTTVAVTRRDSHASDGCPRQQGWPRTLMRPLKPSPQSRERHERCLLLPNTGAGTQTACSFR
jgi:hypothetical protein